MAIFTALNQILFPSRCLICSTLGDSLCTQCRVEWRFAHLKSSYLHQGTFLNVLSSIEYSSSARAILLAAKESQISSADLLIQSALHYAISATLKNTWVDAIVSIPSRPSVVRKRGRHFLAEITQSLANDLGLNHLQLLRHTRTVKDQSGLHQRERWNNLEGAFVVPSEEKRYSGMKVLLIDDLVTTGATLVEGARALRYAGIEVISGVTACIAQPLR
jgi:ComF family protein